jgi:hypothetical protein
VKAVHRERSIFSSVSCYTEDVEDQQPNPTSWRPERPGVDPRPEHRTRGTTSDTAARAAAARPERHSEDGSPQEKRGRDIARQWGGRAGRD